VSHADVLSIVGCYSVVKILPLAVNIAYSSSFSSFLGCTARSV